MAKTEKRRIGDLGEDMACKFLIRRGHAILDRNYLRPWGEIDIISEHNSKLHFVEVKTVTRESGQKLQIRPEENMHRAKVERLQRAIQTYIAQSPGYKDRDWQLDLVCVYVDMSVRRVKVELFENVF